MNGNVDATLFYASYSSTNNANENSDDDDAANGKRRNTLALFLLRMINASDEYLGRDRGGTRKAIGPARNGWRKDGITPSKFLMFQQFQQFQQGTNA